MPLLDAAQKIKIAIVGGGIGGLCLATGLVGSPKFDVTVYEATHEYKRTGQGLAMHGNAIRAMENVDPDLLNAWREASAIEYGSENADAISVTNVTMAYGPHEGTLIAELGQARARKTIARADLLIGYWEVLKAKGGQVLFGKRLESVEDLVDRVNLRFQDGSQVLADCVIGAEGVHSKIREVLLGVDHPALPPKNTFGYVNFRRMVPVEETNHVLSKFWRTNVNIRLGPDGYLLTMPVHKGHTIVLSFNSRVPEGQSTKSARFDKHLLDQCNEEVRELAELMDKGPIDRIDYWDHDPAPTYFRNRICMIGDAAHCTMPFAGNGAAQTVEDAAALKVLFQKLERADDIPKLFEAYDTIRRPRSQEVVEISRQFGRIFTFSEPGVEDVETMQRVVKEKSHFTNDVDIEGENRKAEEVFERLLRG